MTKKVLGIGATLIDELYFCSEAPVLHSSNPANKTTRVGGVVHNIIYHLALLNAQPALITAVGNDPEGQTISAHFKKSGIDDRMALHVNGHTGKYVSVLDEQGQLLVAVCEDRCSAQLNPAYLESLTDYLIDFDLLVTDTNLDTPALQWLIDFSRQHQKPLIIEPVSVTKVAKLQSLDLSGLFLLTPNEEELAALTASPKSTHEEQIQLVLDRGVENLWLRQGAAGSGWYGPKEIQTLPVPGITVVDSTGAGDAALAGWIYGWLQGEDSKTCMQLGHSLALHILQQKGAVDPTMNDRLLRDLLKKYKHESK